ncbi:hypothetical protein SK128_026415 [Halocaridina rubra]|uniref:Uncharacterized protein n=1 Tax=Halocaridina rubra TaxID=373956 RepID=A0AAN8WAN3_HALRR
MAEYSAPMMADISAHWIIPSNIPQNMPSNEQVPNTYTYEREYYDNNAYNNHVPMQSNNRRDFRCEICNKECYNYGTLNSHLVVHSEKREFRCEICDKQFKDSSGVTRHMAIHTGNRKAVKCIICEKEYFDHSTLARHMVIHSGRRDYKCTICEKAFKENSTLKRHMVIHSGRKDFKCDKCGKEFNDRRNFKRHVHLHTGIKDFKCEVCGRKFALKFHLKGHMLTHSDKKDFQCDVCEKKFTLQRYLRDHKLIHTKKKEKDPNRKKDVKCDVCGKGFYNKKGLRNHMGRHGVKRTGYADFQQVMKLCRVEMNIKSEEEADRLQEKGLEKKGKDLRRGRKKHGKKGINKEDFKWTQEAQFTLLELVEDRPILWNQKDPLYHKKMLRKENYEDIADILRARYSELTGLDGKQVLHKFNNIRTYFLRIHKAPSNADDEAATKWPYYQACVFMLEDPTNTPSVPAPKQTLSEMAGSVVLKNDNAMSKENRSTITTTLCSQATTSPSVVPAEISSNSEEVVERITDFLSKKQNARRVASNLGHLLEGVTEKLSHEKQLLMAAKIIATIQEVTGSD